MKDGGPGVIRTHELQLRRLAPYEPHNTLIVYSTGLGNGPCNSRYFLFGHKAFR